MNFDLLFADVTLHKHVLCWIITVHELGGLVILWNHSFPFNHSV